MPTPAASFLSTFGQRTEPNNVADAAQRMWGAVILRAIADAVWVDPNPTGSVSEKISFWATVVRRGTANRMRDEAVFWFTLPNDNFREVCLHAGVDPDNVRRLAMRAMESSDEDKARLAAAADLSLRDLRPPGELRRGRENEG